MAHLKLSMVLKETGYDRETSRRFQVYLTNSLEEHHPDTNTIFAQWLSNEANEANRVKRDTPVMVIMGNPPYSVSSNNKGEWIQDLIADYKKDLNEKNIQPLSDDYIKFIRYGQHFIDKNGEGILAYISNNSFIDGLIHRRMRNNLINIYDKIYILNLHGDDKKKKSISKKVKDENVFDIQQGVSINLFIKNKEVSKSKRQLFYYSLIGKRCAKYEFLSQKKLEEISWNPVKCKQPYYFFEPKNFELSNTYDEWFSLKKIFLKHSLGIEFGSKKHLVSVNKRSLCNFVETKLLNKDVSDDTLKTNYGLKTTSGWRFEDQRKKSLKRGYQSDFIKECLSSPFNKKYTYHSNILRRPQLDVLRNLHYNNVALLTLRQTRASEFGCVFVTNSVYSKDAVSIIDRTTGFPLYLYPETNGQQTLDGKPERKPNLDPGIVQKIADGLGFKFVPERPTPPSKAGHPSREGISRPETFAPINLLDYIYAVLHSPTYREKYKEFLKIDFPRVPYPNDVEKFWKLVKLGGELRKIHLLEHPVVDNFITTFPKSGTNEITKRLTKTQPGFIPYEEDDTEDGADHRYPNEPLGKVQINKKQYFGRVPQKAWNFYIGGYQPAQKWLKDRRGREGLNVEEVRHYQKIIIALMETDRLMQEIDEIDLDE
jgi:predicted helicase